MHPKVFVISGVVFGAGMILGLMGGIITGRTGSTTGPMQANEAPDQPVDAEGTVVPSATTVVATAKRYTQAPALSIDPSQSYVATIKTSKGDIQLELYPNAAPEAVNAFVFLAKDGYYDGTQFMELLKNPDGSKFYAQAGDPTNTGLGTPGFSIKKEQSSKPFAKGAVGMGGTAENSNGGQFFISFGDYPALNGKYTIFGQVVSGLDVLEKLSLAEVKAGRSSSAGDKIDSVTVTER
jgi:cyclophilin family peptidyl-prolyl cis-trans isomerase